MATKCRISEHCGNDSISSPKGMTHRIARYNAVLLAVLLTACSAPGTVTAETEAEISVTSAVQQDTESEAPTETTPADTEVSAEESDTSSGTYDYVHGEDGYYNIIEDGIYFRLVPQLSGTCWICASSCSMITAYQKHHDGLVELDQMDLVDEIYNDDKDEGVFVKEGIDKEAFGGNGTFVVNQLSRGFGDGLVVDGAVSAQDWTNDEIKEGIKKYGAMYIGIPDTDRSKKKYFGQYFTMNFPNAKEDDFDHSIAVIGWDDNFPKEYFRDQAEHDGAWITYNSNFSKDYYYVSYDTPFDQIYDPPLFISLSDAYSKVLSHDCGWWHTDPVVTGETTTTANVFRGKGTLSAVGTYSLTDDQDLTISILTPDLSECLYTQEEHIDLKGYHVIELDEPREVDEYAIAVSYTGGAPVEGKSKELDPTLHIDTVIKSGQSFILIDGEWLDMSKKETWDKCGCETNNACIRALYIE